MEGLDELEALTRDDPAHTEYVEPGSAERQALKQYELVTGGGDNIPGEEEEEEGEEQDPGFIADNPGQAIGEVAAAIVGGGADAVESVGKVADLTGDTLKTGWNQLFGQPTDASENPFSAGYQEGNWLDIPDEWVPENKTGLGKLARGLVEFGVLTAATGGVGGVGARAVGLGGVKLTTRAVAASRAAGVGRGGTRAIKFISKGGRIAAEGGAAELISSQSEEANIANLVNEHAPWIPFSEALAIAPEDNPWLARIKSVTAGAGVNLVGWQINAFARGKWAAKRAQKAGKSIDEANLEGNKVYQDEMAKQADQAEAGATETAANRYVEGRGVSHVSPRDEYLREYLDEAEYAKYVDPDSSLDNVSALDEIADARGLDDGNPWDIETGQSARQFEDGLNRKPDPFVNPNKFDNSDKIDLVVEPDAVGTHLRTSINDLKAGGTGRGWKNIWTSSAIKRMTQGSKQRLAILERTREELVEKAFKSPDNTMSYKDIERLVDHHVEEGLDTLLNGGDIAANFKKLLKEDPNNYRVFMDDGVSIKTITPAQKAAVQLNLAMLADTVSGLSQGAMQIADNVPIARQYEMVMDAMKVLLVEHKRYSVMWGLDGVAQQVNKLPGALKEAAEKRLKEIEIDNEEYFSALDALRKENRYTEMKNLMEIHALSGNKINTLEQVNDFLWSKLRGGEIKGVKVSGRVAQQLLSTFYNSILSSVRTPIKAIVGTNMITTLRPFSAFAGAAIRGNKTEMAVSAAMIDSIRHGLKESFEMFKYNWDLGLNRQAQSYDIRYNLAEDLDEWKQIGKHIEGFGTDAQKRAYGVLNWSVNFNTSPWVKYSANAMGAGDAFARTLIGRMEMRHRAVRQAIADGIDLDDVNKVARKSEENFRNSIFKEGKDGKWVVHDKATMMAGDEAAMTTALEGWTQGMEKLNEQPILRGFFPFIRTGVNALSLTFKHTPLAYTQRKMRHIIQGKNLELYGIRPEDAAQAKALVEGRIAIGTALAGATTLVALNDRMTGDYPYDKESRDLWKLKGIQPYSFKIGNKWVSYQNLEPFNTIFSIQANLVQNADILGESMVDEWQKKVQFMLSAVLVDKSMLSGVKDLVSVLDDSETGGYQLERSLARKLRPLILPYAGLSKDIGNVLDSIERENQTLLEQIQSREVFFKSALPPKYDILSKDRSGKPFTRGALSPYLRIFNAVSPIAIVETQEPDIVRDTLNGMRYNLPEVLSSYKGVKLNAMQRSRLQYHLSRGSLRKRLERVIYKDSYVVRGLAAYKRGHSQGRYRESQGWKLSNEKWYQIVHTQFREAHKEAMALVLAEDVQLRRDVASMESKKTVAKSGDWSRREQLELLSTPGSFPK